MPLRSTLRPAVLAATCWLTFAAGCDDAYTPPAGSSATTAPAAAAVPVADNGVRERIQLNTIPFSVEVPTGWVVKPDVANKMVLHGRTPNGEVDVLLGAGPTIKTDSLPLLVKQSTTAATESADRHVKNAIAQRDRLTIVTRIAPQLAPGATASSDPELVPMGWGVQVIVSGHPTDLPSYQLSYVGLSQAIFDKDEAFLQKIIDSLRYEPASMQPTAP